MTLAEDDERISARIFNCGLRLAWIGSLMTLGEGPATLNCKPLYLTRARSYSSGTGHQPIAVIRLDLCRAVEPLVKR